MLLWYQPPCRVLRNNINIVAPCLLSTTPADMLGAKQGSGLRRVLNSHVEDSRISLAATTSTVQAKARLSDRSLFKVHLEGSSPFVLQAVLHDMRRRCTASSFIHSNLFPQLQKIAGTGAGLSCSRSSSPLYCALIKLTHAFAELNPKAPAKEAHTALLQTDCSIAVLDIESGRLHTLCFGRHAHVSQISGVVSERGHILEPVSIREHTVRKTSLFEATYENFHGQQYVVLGSPGLWRYTHPRKAGLQAAAYGSAPHLSTFNNPHDASTAVVRAALRTVVCRCTASPYARLSCIHSLPQLDRLNPGSRAEANCKGMIPRMRGDVHPDLTAAVLSFTLHPDSNTSSPRSVLSTFGAEHTAQHAVDHNTLRSLQALVAKRTHASHALDHAPNTMGCSLSAVSAENSAQHSAAGSTAALSSNIGTPKNRWSEDSTATPPRRQTHSQAMQCSSASTAALSSGPPKPVQHAKRHISVARFDSISSIDTPVDSAARGVSTTPSAVATGVDEECERVLLTPLEEDEAHRRWGLVKTYVNVLSQERELRRNLWEAAISAVMNPLAPAGSSSETLFSSFFLSEEPKEEESKESIIGAGKTRADLNSQATSVKAVHVSVLGLKEFFPTAELSERITGASGAGMMKVLEQLRQRKLERGRSSSEKLNGSPDADSFVAASNSERLTAPGGAVEWCNAAFAAQGVC